MPDGLEQPSAKARAASPRVTTAANEVDAPSVTGAADDKLPLLEDVMQLARLGEIPPMQKLFDDGKITADYKDSEGITPLHWSAINNHYAMCKFLLDAGADVDAKGGEAGATPAMWAAQRCHYYIVALLLRAGADPSLTDAQGYNLLHLATFDGNPLLLTLLLHHDGVSVDVPDRQGHTCLMWAAYKGFPTCVDLFLRWGAGVGVVDENGFTALHWSIVKGSVGCMQKLLEYGADRFAVTSDGKTPETVAMEMKSYRMWTRALQDSGYNNDGSSRLFPLPFGASLLTRDHLNKIYFLYPFILIFAVVWILSNSVVFIGVPLALFLAYIGQFGAQKLLIFAPPDMKHIHRTPFLAGIFAGTCFWVGVRWLTQVLPNTFTTHPFLNLIFGGLYGLCSYFYGLCMIEDPGYVPKLGGRREQKAIIDELVSAWKYDESSFCTHCMIRKPLRSRHCKRCKRCMAKHDHHCPWINSCVGANNLRHFVLYIFTMEIGVLIFIWLVLSHLELLPAPSNPQCNILAENICSVIERDNFTVILTIWTGLQLTWVTMLIFVQCVQIARATTTSESMNGHIDQGSHASEAITAALTSGSTSVGGAQIGPTHGAAEVDLHHGHGHASRHEGGCFAQWKKLLGLDTFMATAQSAADGRASHRPRNPFSRGVRTNCSDFWCDSAPIFGQRETGLGMVGGEVINYSRMYDMPSRLKYRRQDGGNSMYHNVSADDEV